jgi:hypothetical protein
MEVDSKWFLHNRLAMPPVTGRHDRFFKAVQRKIGLASQNWLPAGKSLQQIGA